MRDSVEPANVAGPVRLPEPRLPGGPAPVLFGNLRRLSHSAPVLARAWAGAALLFGPPAEQGRRHSLLGPPRHPATLRSRFGSFSSFRSFGCGPPGRRPFRSQLAAHPRFRPASRESRDWRAEQNEACNPEAYRHRRQRPGAMSSIPLCGRRASEIVPVSVLLRPVAQESAQALVRAVLRSLATSITANKRGARIAIGRNCRSHHRDDLLFCSSVRLASQSGGV